MSCGIDENIQWSPIDSSGSRDAEFQYLTDMNAREIMAAFMMSPDELAGYQHLSRGSNSQSLSESNNEFKLEASRDVGIRPLLASFEDFININLLPLIDPDLATKAKVRLVGLDTDNAEKEAVRLGQDSALHMHYDEILSKVEKEPMGKKWGGELPLNPVVMENLNAFFTVGEILEHFCNREGAAKDPTLAYRRDPFFFQWYQLKQQEALAAQQAAQPQPDPNAPEGGGPPTQKSEPDELGSSIDQAYGLMYKSEDNLPANKRQLLAAHKKTVEYFQRGFLEDARDATKDILEIVKHHHPKKT